MTQRRNESDRRRQERRTDIESAKRRLGMQRRTGERRGSMPKPIHARRPPK